MRSSVLSTGPPRSAAGQLPTIGKGRPHEGSSISSSPNGISRTSMAETASSGSSVSGSLPRVNSSVRRGLMTAVASAAATEALPTSACPSPDFTAGRPRQAEPKRAFGIYDTRTNARINGEPAKWKGAAGGPAAASQAQANAKAQQAKTPEARVMAQSYQQFISLKVLLAESRRYAWANIVLRHPEAAGDEVLVYQFNSTWCQLVDDVTAAIVERQVPNVGGASSIVNMMELFQRHSPAVDLLPDCTAPIGPRHLPIDWYEAQRPDVRAAVVEERQARKGRAVAKAMGPLTQMLEERRRQQQY